MEKEEYLPENEEYSETISNPQEEVEANPRRFIIEECLPACEQLWANNIYTFMVSDKLNEGTSWIEMVWNGLSDENKRIYEQLTGDDIVKFSYHRGTVNFGVRHVGRLGQSQLLELAKHFKMQDVPEGFAYVSHKKFLMDYCNCYDEIPNPNYREMKPIYEVNLSPEEMADYILKYDEWYYSDESNETLRVFNPNKATKSIQELAAERGMIVEGDRVYLSEFHYKKHLNYLRYLSENNNQRKKVEEDEER